MSASTVVRKINILRATFRHKQKSKPKINIVDTTYESALFNLLRYYLEVA